MSKNIRIDGLEATPDKSNPENNKQGQQEGHTPGKWEQGYTIMTTYVKTWPKAFLDVNNVRENKAVFTNFSKIDEGKSRKLICNCQRKEDAERIVQCVNGWDGLKKERDELRAALIRARNVIALAGIKDSTFAAPDTLKQINEALNQTNQ